MPTADSPDDPKAATEPVPGLNTEECAERGSLQGIARGVEPDEQAENALLHRPSSPQRLARNAARRSSGMPNAEARISLTF
jgi:hypothetical protein